jgi:aminoglycoside/choline kinase family phosphotransferase
MADRDTRARTFLAEAGWGAAVRSPLAGDASNRRYERLRAADTGATAVLMDAPPERGEDVGPFCAIARHLSALGLSAPALLAVDEAHGFLLLEDLGDALLARVAAADPALERPGYTAAVDALIALHRSPLPPGITAYDAPVMARLAGLAYDKYAAGVHEAPDPARRDAAIAGLQGLIAAHAPAQPVLVLRDYHAENLLWLPERAGPARVGLLDFQDAMAGHPAYDLVSLLQDVRRDVPAPLEAALIAHYLAQTGADPLAFRAAYAVMGAQRHLRVLGVFARLCTDYGKPHYLNWMPRVWALLERCLADPALAPVADLLRRDLPPPDAAILQTLRDRCPGR